MNARAPAVAEPFLFRLSQLGTLQEQPLDDDAFAALIAPLGPFERAPELAVAVSGGPDSMALCLLAQAWVRARHGNLTALIVDHGLRPASAAEARQTEVWLGQHGIRRQVLSWQGPKPASGIQAAARSARYALLGDWCRAHGVLHLLLGHHRDDQRETRLLRAARGSGPDGLAGMAAVREITGLRLLRPLLSVPKQRLIATLQAAGQPWIEDPSNHAAHFARARLRQAAGSSYGEPEPSYATRRAALDRESAAWLAALARIDPAGFVTWPRQAFVQAPPEIMRRTLQQALAVVGGDPYPPRKVRLERLIAALVAPGCGGRTLAGCRIIPRGADLLICREPAAIAPAMALAPDRWQRWDRRFLVRVHRHCAAGSPPPSLMVRALDADGWRQCRQGRHDALRDLPAAVRAGLPSVWQEERLLAVARLGSVDPAARLGIALRFRPQRPLAGAPFVASAATEDPTPYPWSAGNHTFASTWRQPMLRWVRF